MRKQFLCSGCSLVGMAFFSVLTACSSTKHAGAVLDAGQPPVTDAGHPPVTDAGHPPVTDAGHSCTASAPDPTYVLIDDMETTTHGPIDSDVGVLPPLSPGYWYNSGAGYAPDGGAVADTSNPPSGSFTFSALATPTMTFNCKVSAHAARQSCALNGLYDTCGVGFEFAQEPEPDAAAATGDAAVGDAGAPKVTVPFDISRYKAIKFWGMTTTPDPTAGSMQVKVQLPDTDTDPRGEVCNGAGPNISQCYNSYGSVLSFTTSWQEFTVMLDAGDGGVPAAGGIAIDPSFGYQQARWIPTQVYGINRPAQTNITPDAGPPLMTDIWIDDVYFIE